MSKILIKVPSSVKVTGTLHSRTNIHDLTEDMLQLELPGNLFIDVGWYPQWDKNGSYVILVFRNTVDETIQKIETRSVISVSQRLKSLLIDYMPGNMPRQSQGSPSHAMRLIAGGRRSGRPKPKTQSISTRNRYELGAKKGLLVYPGSYSHARNEQIAV